MNTHVRRLAWLLAVALLVAPTAEAAAKPKPRRGSQQYDLSIVGFNDGEPWRVKGAEVEALFEDSALRVWEFIDRDWMAKPRRGRLIAANDVVARYPEQSAADLFKVYRFDADGDRAPEYLVVATPRLFEAGGRYAPTLLSLTPNGLSVLWHAGDLQGERFRLADIRDVNSDLDPEFVVVGEAGQSGAYQFMAVVARAPRNFVTFTVQNVDSLHYVDLDRDGRAEIVHRERVGRKGAAHQWTYIDRLFHWNGQAFETVEPLFPRYHDEQTLPTLVGELIDHFDARQPILDEKVDAIEKVRGLTMAGRAAPQKFHTKKVQAMAHLQKLQFKQARASLDALVAAWPFDAQVQLAVAAVAEHDRNWSRALEASIRAITIEPSSREAWYRAAMALTELQERSSAVACAVLSVVLGGPRNEGIAWLRARRGEPGMDADLQGVLDEALGELDALR